MIAHPYVIAFIAIAWPCVIGIAASVNDEPETALALTVIAILTAIVAWPT